MSDSGKEGLLKRWSRLKRQSVDRDKADGLTPARGAPESERTADATDLTSAGVGTAIAAEGAGDESSAKHSPQPLPALPSVEELGPESDFAAFMDPRVDDNLRRVALKTLFRDPGFNVTDGLDVYAEDYTKLEKLTPAMVAALRYAQRTLFGGEDERGGELARAEETQSADTEEAVVVEPPGGRQTEETSTAEHVRGLDETEPAITTQQPEQMVSESKHTRSDKS